MQEYLTNGYIRKLADIASIARQKNDWYLPIFPVTNPNKPGKIRMVFDAAANVGGVSLNYRLLPGPAMLAGLYRESRSCCRRYTRDVPSSGHQREADQRSQMILWDTEHPDAGSAIYVVTVMTFGAACSPSSAQYVKNLNAERFAAEYQRAAECILHEHYVNDMLASVETVEKAKALADAVRYIHACGGFEIRNWISNSREIVQHLQKHLGEEGNVNLNFELSTEKVLGLWWNMTTDTFTFRLTPKHDKELLSGRKAPTKREILRTLMSIYDPSGLLGNLLMYLKSLLQEVWREGIGWDQKLSDRTAEKWARWLRVLPDVETVVIPRCYRFLSSVSANVQFHVFCDASENGMAALAYFRFEEETHIECALIAAVIGARLAHTVARDHRLVIKRTVFWTDSKNFVAFRVGEVLEATNLEQWRWIPTKLNVADERTKWSIKPDLSAQERWLSGPSFLWEPESAWPDRGTTPWDTAEELRNNMHHHRVEEPLIQLERFSRWNCVLRAVAYVTRFIANARRLVKKKAKVSGPLTQEEIGKAECILIQIVQQKAYHCEINSLKKRSMEKHPWKKGIEKSSCLYKLSPILDDEGVLRVGGRLTECVGVNTHLRNPIILP
uniref:Uncharacterized protein n=1 Tax=Anopheles christyi TaxID=43041 RepID=A0A182KFS3_9DIPT